MSKPYWSTDKKVKSQPKQEEVQTWKCPGCNWDVPVDTRYPRYLCHHCEASITDGDGYPVTIKDNGFYLELHTPNGQVYDRYVYHLDHKDNWKRYTYKKTKEGMVYQWVK